MTRATVEAIRNSASDAELASAVAADPPAFRNAFINGDFQVWQRDTSFSISSDNTYTADRWVVGYDGTPTITVSRQAFTLGQTDVPGEPEYFLRWDNSGAGSGGTYKLFLQRIEDVRTFAGQTVTLSFYAKANAALTINMALQQGFGFGGSPSVSVDTSLGAASVTTSWQRFTATVSLPSISGKTLGTSGSDRLELQFRLPLNTTFIADIANVQLEAGSAATDFERLPYAEQLRRCQRYYEIVGMTVTDTGQYINAFSYMVEKRISPTLSVFSGSLASGSVLAMPNKVTSQIRQQANSTSPSDVAIAADAEL